MRTITKAEIIRAVAEQCDGIYPMSLVGSQRDWVKTAVNIGIDAHLQACYVPARGDSFDPWDDIIDGSDGKRYLVASRLECRVSGESLAVLLRRLTENVESESDDGDCPDLLAGDILDTLGFDVETCCYEINTDDGSED